MTSWHQIILWRQSTSTRSTILPLLPKSKVFLQVFWQIKSKKQGFYGVLEYISFVLKQNQKRFLLSFVPVMGLTEGDNK